MPPNSQDFIRVLNQIFDANLKKGNNFVIVISGELHRAVGGYPGSNHRMPICCGVMYNEIKNEDEIINQPPSRQGASLEVKYRLPR